MGNMIDMKNYDINSPLIIGLAGKAGSGKTSVAEQIVPKGSVDTLKYGFNWDHIFFALPLYELASIKKNIMGINESSRRMYAIHEVLYDLFGGSPIANVPSYPKLVAMVEEIASMKIEPEGVKPRTFLQNSGDVCRIFDEDCFANWGVRKSKQLHYKHIKNSRDLELDGQIEDINPFAVVISDVRFENEAKAILEQPNGIVITFDASKDTLDERILKRDGKLMSEDQKSHKSEQYIDLIKDISTYVINTDNMTIEEQTEATINAIESMKKINA
jgi:cytidylate kinase